MPTKHRRFLSIGAIALVCLIGLSVAAVEYRRRASAYPSIQAPGQPPGQPRSSVFVPQGMPVTLSEAGLTIERPGKSAAELITNLTLRVAAQAGIALSSLTLIAFEFEAGGKPRRIDGWIRTLEAGENEISLPVNRRLRPGGRLVLTVERANAADRSWSAEMGSLARGAAAVLAGQTPPEAVARQETTTAEDAGSALCANGLRRVRRVAESYSPSDRAAISSFTCDQRERSFSAALAQTR